MELRLELEYDQILKLVQQLPKDKIDMLIRALNTESHVRLQDKGNSLEKLIRDAPVWSDEQLKEYFKVRQSFNTSGLG